MVPKKFAFLYQPTIGYATPPLSIFYLMKKEKPFIHPDQRFIQGLIDNDSEVIEEIYQKNAGRIKNFVLRNNGNADDANDLFQEILIAFYHQGKNGMQLRCPFEIFLYIACRNRWINELKKRRKSQVTITDITGLKISTSFVIQSEHWMEREKKETIFYQKYQELGPSCQEILGLSWTINPDSGKYNSLVEIANTLNRSYKYIRKKISTCRSRLVELVQGSGALNEL